MQKGAFAELVRAILEIVGEESITIRRECGEDGNIGLVILIGIDKLPEK